MYYKAVLEADFMGLYFSQTRICGNYSPLCYTLNNNINKNVNAGDAS